MKNIRLSIDSRPYVLMQRTEILPKRNDSSFLRLLTKIGLRKNYNDYLTSYSRNHPEEIDLKYSEIMRSEARFVMQHIPKKISKILDIGCGIPALQAYLFNLLDSNPQLFLLDRTRIEQSNWYLYEEKSAFYNSLEIGEEILKLNKVPPENINLIEAPDDGNITLEPKSLNLIISTISWGFHYPISTYIESVYNILSDSGILIVDVRKNTEGEGLLNTLFVTEVIKEEKKYRTLKCVKI